MRRLDRDLTALLVSLPHHDPGPRGYPRNSQGHGGAGVEWPLMRSGLRRAIDVSPRTMVDESAMIFADDAVCSQLAQARAYVPGSGAKALGDVLRREAIGRTAQHPDNTLRKVGFHFCPRMWSAKSDKALRRQAGLVVNLGDDHFKTWQAYGCVGCKEAAPMTDRERIEVARDKFELEMKRDTRRPWDGSDLYRKNPSAKAPVKDAA
jgi:hypothetical protein